MRFNSVLGRSRTLTTLYSTTLSRLRTFRPWPLWVSMSGGECLSLLFDEDNQPREQANLPAYLLAEWLAWNWWRLRWEPCPHRSSPHSESSYPSWDTAHCMKSIGDGWIWPNITIDSDGANVTLRALPEDRSQLSPVSYVSHREEIVLAESFEKGVATFVDKVLERLDEHPSLEEIALPDVWQDLKSEWVDPQKSLYRKLEACAGFGPDEAPEGLVDRLIQQCDRFRREAVSEVALDDPSILSSVQDIARNVGEEISAEGLLSRSQGLDSEKAPASESLRPWKEGFDAAQSLREELGYTSKISDRDLAGLCGITQSTFLRKSKVPSLSFVFDKSLVLQSYSRQSRRFGAARLLGDRLLAGEYQSEILRPATRSHTYRQKRQRAFAAQLLCPIIPLRDFLRDDVSEERRQDAAQYFGVSQATVTFQLINNGDLDRFEAPDWVGRYPA